MMETRLESDSIGTLELESNAYYGVQSLRAKQNFGITNRKLRKEMIESLAQIKMAAALCNSDIHTLDSEIANKIVEACEMIIEGKYHDSFIVDPIQGGAGTSTNMNANEVIANIANVLMGGKCGEYNYVHPNDHVNMAQSTNDVYPTAGKLTIIKLIDPCLYELERLVNALQAKSIEFNDVFKMGRTQLQDAVPMRLGQSFKAYSNVIKRDILRIKAVRKTMLTVNMGGTAIGTAINVDPEYLANIDKMLSYVVKEDICKADDLIDATQNLDGFSEVSSALKTCAINLSKMANDLRLLSSGPKAGIGEINLPPKQNGSSIMPGKVNPVIPEVISQIAYNIIGNDVTVTMACEAGQMELNAFEPVLLDNIFESITMLTNGVTTFIDNCIEGITANKDKCQEYLDSSVGTITAVCPYLGYQEAAKLAKEALHSNQSVMVVLKNHHLFDDNQLQEIMKINKMTDPTLLQSKY